MSEELRDHLRAAADEGGGSRPDAADLWRTGRRRRTARRAMGATAVVVVVLAVGAAALAVGSDEGRQQVRTTDVPVPIAAGSCDPPPTADGQAPPRTIEEFVHGSPGAPATGAPTVIARGVVEDVLWFGPAQLPTDDPADPVSWYRIVTIVVTDPVVGAKQGDILEVLVAGPLPSAPATAQTDEAIARGAQETRRRIDDLQGAIDEINRPLAELDAQILELDPEDPRYQALIATRAEVKERGDQARQEAEEELSAEQMELRRFDLADRSDTSPEPPTVSGPPCHSFGEGDDVILALAPKVDEALYQLASPSSFFVVDPDGTLSSELDDARRSVPSWDGDTELLRLARESTADEFLDRLRQAAAAN